jgi:hypothetical protein
VFALVAILFLAACDGNRAAAPRPLPSAAPSASAVASSAVARSWFWSHAKLFARPGEGAPVRVSICLPTPTKDLTSAPIVSFPIEGRADLAVEIMYDTTGPYPLRASVPRANDETVLIESAELAGGRWAFTSRDPKRGILHATTRIPDPEGEDVICMARTVGRPAREDDALRELLAICSSMENGVHEGACSPPPGVLPKQ